MDTDAKSWFALLVLVVMGYVFISGVVLLYAKPHLTTVTIHKQDRLSLPCDQEGAQ